MNEQIQTICTKLDFVAESILNYGIGSSYGTTRMLHEFTGGFVPPLVGEQLAWYARSLASRIREGYVEDEEPEKETLDQVLASLNYWSVNPNLIQSMFSGNAQQAVPSYLVTLQYIAFVFAKESPDWQTISHKGMMPKELARRLRAVDTDLKQLAPDKEELREQIRLIKEAHETADSLPVDLQRLKEANEQINLVSKQASELYGGIKDYPDLIKKELDDIHEKNTEAQGLVKQSREAYRITTSIGLAGAFDERASKSEFAMWVWVAALIIALGLGAWLGGIRVNELIKAVDAINPNWGVITIHSIITLFSFGGPIWFAWLSTKQISQRFRLAEDYAYKASIAKAYEGFRQEANRIDPEFESRLFGSTLTRFDEAPIRLFDSDMHGSPWHELFSSKAFQNMIKTVPDFKDELLQLIKDKFPSYDSPDKTGKAKVERKGGEDLE